ncbi:uncharacterized protein TNCV_1075401 [Trichonephila clavipes]|uniref:Uncharacterized protein n=1 Tax=Trichonephila clavipes TaxID=2585209 RepID=A0A8X6SUU2_TRICX|nr:uncharacterized protein TNCV_1075401 [Trichonephila clavipes]
MEISPTTTTYFRNDGLDEVILYLGHYAHQIIHVSISFYSDEGLRLNESDYEESEESADVIDNIPVNPDMYVTGDSTEWIPHNSNDPGRFVTQKVLRQSSGHKLRET